MSDYIPRLYAIAAIENQIKIKEPTMEEPELIEAYNAGYRTAMAQARLELMNIKSKTDWIPVEEKGLPKEEGTYLITDTMQHVCLAEFNPTYIESRQWWSIDFNQYIRGITAWMPMPDAYRKRGGDRK